MLIDVSLGASQTNSIFWNSHLVQCPGTRFDLVTRMAELFTCRFYHYFTEVISILFITKYEINNSQIYRGPTPLGKLDDLGTLRRWMGILRMTLFNYKRYSTYKL